jgi:GAF domain-containing protein
MGSSSDDTPGTFPRSDDLLEILGRGRAFAEELLRENERLRLRVVQLEHGGEIEAVRAENAVLRERIAVLERRFADVESVNTDFGERFLEVERQNEALANLYVASYQLHATLDPAEVIAAIAEIVTGLVGAREFAILLVDDEGGRLDLAAGEGVEMRFPTGSVPLESGIEARVARSGEAFFGEDGPDREPVAYVPLMLMGRCVGLICIYRMLSQKRGAFTAVDHELLNLLAGQAAAALVSSRLYAASGRY